MLFNAIEPVIFNSERQIPSCHLTETELRQLHRRFGHPSVRRLKDLLDRAGHDADSSILKRIAEYCEHCQRHGGPPGRFKFSIKDDKEFNHSVYIDILDLCRDSALQVVCESTGFQAARFVLSMSAKHAWEALRACWIDVYQGPPDFIIHDPGTNFDSKEFRDNARSIGSDVKMMPVESHNSIGKVERYHIPLRRAFVIISREIPSLGRNERLQIAVKTVNNTAGPHGLVPTLLVFGAYPRIMDSDPPSPDITERAGAIKKAMAEVRACHARRKVADALRMRNGPQASHIHDLPLNSEVMVWREGRGWEGPATLLGMDGESCLIGFKTGRPRTFRSTKLKPFKRFYPEGSVEPEIETLPEDEDI